MPRAGFELKIRYGCLDGKLRRSVAPIASPARLGARWWAIRDQPEQGRREGSRTPCSPLCSGPSSSSIGSTLLAGLAVTRVRNSGQAIDEHEAKPESGIRLRIRHIDSHRLDRARLIARSRVVEIELCAEIAAAVFPNLFDEAKIRPAHSYGLISRWYFQRATVGHAVVNDGRFTHEAVGA